jgi:hypothetical protein
MTIRRVDPTVHKLMFQIDSHYHVDIVLSKPLLIFGNIRS